MLFSGRCLYETRNVMATGSVNASGGITASAELILAEQRDYQPDKNFSWTIVSAPLKGHAERIVLQDNSAGARILYEFPIATDPRPALSSGFVTQSQGGNINGFFDLLSSDRGLIVITTDLPALPSLTVPLTPSRKDDWSRPYCS